MTIFLLIRSGSLLNSNNEERIILWESGVERELKNEHFPQVLKIERDTL